MGLGIAELFVAILAILIPIGLVIVLIVLISSWASKSNNLKKEQNQLLKELINTLVQKKG